MIVPRVTDTIPLLESLYPIHGLLLTEGEDVGPELRPPPLLNIPHADLKEQHSSDATPDITKDSIEHTLVQHCLQNTIPLLAICRGAQLVNLAAGGTLYDDVTTQHPNAIPHICYDNYDAYRHPVHIARATPMYGWFDRAAEINVNSYHHQGISNLAARFRPMARAPDGLVEAYYDPACYDIPAGRFLVGLQFHPERMQDVSAALDGHAPLFEYQGCVRPYRDFAAAAAAYQRTLPHRDVLAADVGPMQMPRHAGIRANDVRSPRYQGLVDDTPRARDARRKRVGDDGAGETGTQDAELLGERWRHVQMVLKGMEDDGDIVEAEALLDELSLLGWHLSPPLSARNHVDENS